VSRWILVTWESSLTFSLCSFTNHKIGMRIVTYGRTVSSSLECCAIYASREHIPWNK
jgi:hypothetical protein